MTIETAQLWLPEHALNCYEGNPRLRSWLATPGLLTQRMRDTAGEAFRMNVLREYRAADGDHLREIELTARGVPWVFAQTRVPASTLSRHPWLAQIGDTALGEALAAHGRVSRTDFEYGRLTPDDPLVALALARRELAPQPLWIRRSTFAVDDAPLVVQEVFFPDVGS
jgi:chorismate-pyruvate lyase